MKANLDTLTPKQIVVELDKYIIGQDKAKRSVAIALRNRLRRKRLPAELQDEIAPKNIIMIGPTGVGKTEIARRLSRLSGAPFIKVEATKYTEVGYVGRDVESMVRDLVSVAISMVKREMQEGVREEAEKRAEEDLLDLLLPGSKKVTLVTPVTPVTPVKGFKSASDLMPGSEQVPAAAAPPQITGDDKYKSTREKFKERLRKGEFEEKLVEIKISRAQAPAFEIFAGMGFEEMDVNISNLSNLFGGKKKLKKTRISRAREILIADEMDKLVDMEHVSEMAIERVEEMGIIFLDEIDKIASKENRGGVDVSREGVQRDILPIVEGCKVNTRYGMVDTAHILFIAAGAFHMSKPSDLIPELQGRFPLRVELNALSSEDFREILTQPRNALITQYIELLKTENVELEFSDEAIKKISVIASEVNSKTENIGARRLHTILELVLEDVSFNATDISGQKVEITEDYVEKRLRNIIEDRDLTRFIL